MNIDLAKLTLVGENIKVGEVEGQIVIVIDPKVNLGPSASGKMTGVASSGGFTTLPGGMKANIYVGKKA